MGVRLTKYVPEYMMPLFLLLEPRPRPLTCEAVSRSITLHRPSLSALIRGLLAEGFRPLSRELISCGERSHICA